MNQNNESISDYWRQEYSENIQKYSAYEASKQFNQIASLFTPGKSYYYVLNMHNLELDHLSPSVKEFVGEEPENITMEMLLALALPSEIQGLQMKEKLIKDFYIKYLRTEEIMDYKVVYTYKLKDHKGEVRTMLHQATALSVGENGLFEHIFSVHTDVSHLKINSSNTISFINLKGGESFYNIDAMTGEFDPLANSNSTDLHDLFSEREREIIHELARGANAGEIAQHLNISTHTVKTHRKNILHKSGCLNTAHLIAQCLMGGVIQIG